MFELEQYIQSFFTKITDDDLRKLASIFELKKVERGEYIQEAGKRANNLCFVQSGFLRMFNYVEGKEVTRWISSKGYFSVDLGAFIYNIPARWHIQAVTESEIYFIHKNDYSRIGEFIEKWNEIEKGFLINCFTAMENRIFTHLSMTAEERYNYFFELNKELFNQVPLQYIASMLGMTPETFSRIRKKRLP